MKRGLVIDGEGVWARLLKCRIQLLRGREGG